MVRTAQLARLGDTARDRLRHGRHVHRRQPLRRRVRARVRDAGGRRAHARADDEHPHGRGRRRLDPAVRRCALARRPAERRREPGPGVLSPRRAAGGDRCERDGRQDPAGALSEGVRAARRTSRSTATSWSRSSTRWPAEIAARDRRRRHARSRRPTASSHIAVGAMANAHQEASRWRAATTSRSYTLQCFGGAGGQHACRVADALGMTRVFAHPLGRRAVGLRHGPGRPDRDARGGSVELPLDASGLCAAAQTRLTRARRARRATSWSRQGVRRPCELRRARPRALPGHRFGAGGAVRRDRRQCVRRSRLRIGSALRS